MDALGTLLVGGGAGALVLFLLRGWLTERLKQSIQDEYSRARDIHKAELNTRFQAMDHEYQMRQLKTSLFFDHQRSAFASLTTRLSEVNTAWGRLYDPDEGLTSPVPSGAYDDLRTAYHQHQLFLDQDCIAAMEIAFECYRESFSIYDGSGESTFRDPLPAYEAAAYLQPRIAELFRTKIGVSSDASALREVALFAAIRLVNKYHFGEVELPVKGHLEVKSWDLPPEAVRKANENLEELLSLLGNVRVYLRTEESSCHEAATRIDRCLEILEHQQNLSSRP